MATTRFGGVSPAHSYASKVRWLVAGLLTLILLLVFLVIYISQLDQGEAESAETANIQSPAEAGPVNPIGSNVDIIVSAQRIEEGQMLQDYMFRPKPWERESLPEGAILWGELENVRGKFAGKIINANIPVTRDIVALQQPISKIPIPPGFRAVTIEVDRRSGVEGFAKPNSRVDVLFTFEDQAGNTKVRTLVSFCKVLSVGGVTTLEDEQKAVQLEGNTTVTLLVTKDAKKIELARTIGKLSLSLVGDTEPTEGQTGGEDDTITRAEITGEPPPQEEEPDIEEPTHTGVMYSQDPKTGKTRRYLLINGRWKLDQSYAADGSE